MKPKTFQIIMDTDADWKATEEQLNSNPYVDRWNKTETGLLVIYPKTSEWAQIQLTHYGKVNLFYRSPEERLELYQIADKILKDKLGNKPTTKNVRWKDEDAIIEAYEQLIPKDFLRK
jgi:hypothetical protein